MHVGKGTKNWLERQLTDRLRRDFWIDVLRRRSEIVETRLEFWLEIGRSLIVD